jgi:hypothetical protein
VITVDEDDIPSASGEYTAALSTHLYALRVVLNRLHSQYGSNFASQLCLILNFSQRAWAVRHNYHLQAAINSVWYHIFPYRDRPRLVKVSLGIDLSELDQNLRMRSAMPIHLNRFCSRPDSPLPALQLVWDDADQDRVIDEDRVRMSLHEVVALQRLCHYAKTCVRFPTREGQTHIAVDNALYLLFSYCESVDVPSTQLQGESTSLQCPEFVTIVRLRSDFYQDLREGDTRSRRFILNTLFFLALEDRVLDEIILECGAVICADLKQAAATSSQEVRNYLLSTFPNSYRTQLLRQALYDRSLTHTAVENLLYAFPQMFPELVPMAANLRYDVSPGMKRFSYCDNAFFSSLIFRLFDEECEAVITVEFIDVVVTCIKGMAFDLPFAVHQQMLFLLLTAARSACQLPPPSSNDRYPCYKLIILQYVLDRKASASITIGFLDSICPHLIAIPPHRDDIKLIGLLSKEVLASSNDSLLKYGAFRKLTTSLFNSVFDSIEARVSYFSTWLHDRYYVGQPLRPEVIFLALDPDQVFSCITLIVHCL